MENRPTDVSGASAAIKDFVRCTCNYQQAKLLVLPITIWLVAGAGEYRSEMAACSYAFRDMSYENAPPDRCFNPVVELLKLVTEVDTTAYFPMLPSSAKA